MTTRHLLGPALLLGGLLLSSTAAAQPDQASPGPAGEGEGADEQPPPDITEPAGGQQGMAVPPPAAPTREAVCDDGEDNDGDDLPDCADSDCFDNPHCEAGGASERTNATCSDWIDNDGDDSVDCDDLDCQRPDIRVCQGSDRRGSGGGVGAGGAAFVEDDLPELGEGMTVEDLIGTHGDLDGERNDYLCSDGVDNDDDGRTDCTDFGCRFDPQVTVCSGTPGLRFSVVAGIGFSYLLSREVGDVDGDGSFDADDIPAGERADVRFSRIQLRALGPIPFVENSFFLMSARLDRTPRLTFAHFQIPVGEAGHFIALNSGGGNLSSGPIISAAKQPLLEQPFYLYNAFEQGNGAAVEFGGPLVGGRLNFRLVAAGGSGEFNGNVGGRFFRGGNQNFSWTAGAQLGLNVLGLYNRFDSSFLYTRAPLTLAFALGAKYEQRPRERYPAVNSLAWFQYDRFALRLENYTKRELEFGAWQTAWNAQLGILIIPQHLMFAADIGQFIAGEFDDLPEFDSVLRRPIDEFQYRLALHWYWYRNIGILSARYSENQFSTGCNDAGLTGSDLTRCLLDPTLEREFRVEAGFRF